MTRSATGNEAVQYCGPCLHPVVALSKGGGAEMREGGGNEPATQR